VTGVRSALRRAMLALVDNALEHSHPGGTVTLRVRATGDRTHIEVVDEGDGMDPAQAEQLMARFARGRPQAVGHRRRFGLGLALVGSVAAAHGGTLAVHSIPGSGATVSMAIPRIP
jgi:signal transduction histidine kinase